MKIGPLDNKAALTAVNTERKPAAAGGSSTTPEPSAKVALSPSLTLLAGAGDGSFDHAKVDRITQAIRDGRYTVDAEKIADRLINNAQELLGRAPR